MKRVYTLDDAISGEQRRAGRVSQSGIYGLVDEADMDNVRYVGSTVCFAHRLYAHWASLAIRDNPKKRWINSIKVSGGRIAMVVLEIADVGLRQSPKRLSLESEHIRRLSQMGQADLNVTLTPVGHDNSKDSRGKQKRSEFIALQKENEELRAEISRLKAQLFTETRATRLQRCNTLQVNGQRNATPPYRGVAVLQDIDVSDLV